MPRPATRQYGAKKPSKAFKSITLKSVIAWREDLDGLDPEALASCYSETPANVRAMIAHERNRRAGRGELG